MMLPLAVSCLPHWFSACLHLVPFIVGYSVSEQKGGAGAQARLAQIASALIGRGAKVFRQGLPLLKESSAQQLEALQTGGVGARIPMIQRAVEASKQATSNALRDTSNQMATSGVAGTPFASGVLEAARMAGEQTASQIPTNIAQQVIAGNPAGLQQIQAALGLSSAGAQSAGSLAGIQTGSSTSSTGISGTEAAGATAGLADAAYMAYLA